MSPEEFKELKVGAKIRRPGRPDVVYTVINNDPPGNLILIPGRITKVATRAVHPNNWEFDPDQNDSEH
ncbi:MAG: hypothetical protein LAO08_06515 [Acidobacteriia bacterium]|nr:hypothetical protein [Terriglobia bacterium]